MDILTLALLIAIGSYIVNHQQQRKRIALLASHLGHYQIEKLMETLTDGYMRALSQPDTERQSQIWSMLDTAEKTLSEQFTRLVADFARADADATRVSTLPLSIFYTGKLLPGNTFDLRKALAVHAHGINAAVANAEHHAPKDKAFTLLAEMFLMQHPCHWYCKSKGVASARLVLRHQTPYAKVLDSVAPATRQAYCALVAG